MDDCSQSSTNNSCLEKSKPPQIRISAGSSESATMDTFLMPTVQIMVDSPKEPPRGDFSLDSGSILPSIDVDAPIDVNVQGDTSQVFYDYNPESNLDNTTDNVTTATDATPTEDQQR
ncbi:sodium channel protein 60E-like [Drosophila innubila]|uniref:sodium channel protein 60E-like n=1 Tax=Drosophila innubila TaxID=198719 RepID=UPI00148CC938|nr:sodium channel protein 60E-like [Drosophila innubila]